MADSLWQIHAKEVWDQPEARAAASAELASLYDGGLARVLYAGRCAVGRVQFQGAAAEPYFPQPETVRRHFAQALVLQRENGTLGATRQDWELMSAAAQHPDKTYALMLAEAGARLSPPEMGDSNALALFVRDVGVTKDAIGSRKGVPVVFGKAATAQQVAHLLSLVPEDEREDFVTHRNRIGYGAVHEAVTNPHTGIISLLMDQSADVFATVRGRRISHMAVMTGNVPVTLELLALAPALFQSSPTCPETPYEMGARHLEEQSQRMPRPVGVGRLDAAALRLVRQGARGELSAADKQKMEVALEQSEALRDELARARKIARVEECVNVAASALGMAAPYPEHKKALETAHKAGLKGSQLN